MTSRDLAPFLELMAGLGELYGEPVSTLRAEMYFRTLEDLAIGDIRRAATTHAKASKFFPKPAELRESAVGSVEDRAELAWMSVLDLVRRKGSYNEPSAADWADDQTRRSAMELYGGWTRLCECLPGDGVGLATAAKQFKATFGAYARRDERELLPPSKDEAKAILAGLHRKALAMGRGKP